ncbi:DUF1295 domain-containing protein [Aurantiacibacter sp. MUD11]|uniref:DUF1295 domain-containing protein n=1 Tax=Aurantiacibacter sp. MUD11 TaxID=3003265 RepID=UPI0022AA9136|nr:DUF1295 domain-containing protein [Aurantiacibacter sp. MUD11]WAT16933.1 DUF1295 domain-containing protein [Aurantiacibacter sp. MUD11]
MTEALLINAGAVLVMALLLWLVSLATGKVSFVDAVWGGGMAVLALLSFIHTFEPGPQAQLLLAMAVLWGVRLAIYLLRRFLRHGEDERYVRILAEDRAKGHWGTAVLIRVWLMQGVLLFIVSSPAQLGILASGMGQPITTLAWAGFALWLVGIFFEWVGDWQLARFKADPANKGKVMDKGLWRYTRHPNYFGDACVWWGIWLAAMSVDPAAVIWTLPGPLFLTFTLVKWSGAAMTERGMAEKYGEDFADYARRTPAFVPWFPSSPRG